MIRAILKILEEGFYSMSQEHWETYYYYMDYPKDSYGYAIGQLARDFANLLQALGDSIPAQEDKK